VSQQNVELARRIYENGDLLHTTPERIDRVFREQLSEDFEFRLLPDYPEGELVFRGRSGIDELIALLRETWREWRFEPERFLDADEQVVVFARIIGAGEASGAPVELETTHVVSFREGQAVSVQVYRDRAEALEPTGLSA
jgi:ketosteroid isomerase-like protein